jgi:hypothetical protein
MRHHRQKKREQGFEVPSLKKTKIIFRPQKDPDIEKKLKAMFTMYHKQEPYAQRPVDNQDYDTDEETVKKAKKLVTAKVSFDIAADKELLRADDFATLFPGEPYVPKDPKLWKLLMSKH